MVSEKRFPVGQYKRDDTPGPLTISWALAERAYSVYSARHGTSQSLERMGERGGFYPGELDMFVPGWRDDEYGERAAYERGLRRGLAIAKEWDESLCPVTHGPPDTVDWDAAEAQMEREIEEAKR